MTFSERYKLLASRHPESAEEIRSLASADDELADKYVQKCDELRDAESTADRMRAALVHARNELRRARDTDIGSRLLFHTIDPCLTHINETLGDPDEDELP